MEPTKLQQEIIRNPGNTVVLASPGSGKTYVMSEKIRAVLADDRTREYQGVIAISYTRKASANLKQRSLTMGLDSKNSFFGTIDSFCLTQIVLPFGCFVLGYPDNDPVPIALRDLANDRQEDFTWIDRIHPDYLDIKQPTWELLYSLFREGKILIESMQLLALHIIKQCPACREYLKARYVYIFIDEFQDADKYTNGIFCELLAIGLTGVAVGDPNQSIFGYAHKVSKFLLSLKDNPTFKPFSLNENFRCAIPIINYSNRLIDENSTLLPATDNRVFLLTIEGAEENVAKVLSDKIPAICENLNILDKGKIAILVKNRQTEAIIGANMSIPHRVIETTELDMDMNLRSRLYALLLQLYFDKTISIIGIVDSFIDYDNLSISKRKQLHTMEKEIRLVNEHDTERLVSLFQDVANVLLPTITDDVPLSKLRNVLNDVHKRDTYKPMDGTEVVIMTLHKSKGLEFDVVFHLNLNQWEFPGKKIVDGDFNNTTFIDWDQDLDLHYVGITRAKSYCFLVNSTLRTNSRGETKKASPSEFLTHNGVNCLRNDCLIK